MSKLSDRLRSHAEYYVHGVLPCQDMREAADELDRLERAYSDHNTYFQKAEAEIERLEGILAQIDDSMGHINNMIEDWTIRNCEK